MIDWKKRFNRKAILIVLTATLAGGLALLLLPNLLVGRCAGKVYDAPERTPVHEYGLLLGTAPRFDNIPNRYFVYRINAAAALYRAGKIKKIILSGDNGRVEYNEPEAMRNALMEQGVPEEDLICDYAGFRTLDSVVRARNLFQCSKILIISQRFHCERAIYLARAHGIDAEGYAAEDVPNSEKNIRMRLREPLARCAAFLDLYLFRSKPRFEY